MSQVNISASQVDEAKRIIEMKRADKTSFNPVITELARLVHTNSTDGRTSFQSSPDWSQKSQSDFTYYHTISIKF